MKKTNFLWLVPLLFLACSHEGQETQKLKYDAKNIKLPTSVSPPLGLNPEIDKPIFPRAPASGGGGNSIPNKGCRDQDKDGVCDIDDFCPGGDDKIDTDSDGTPDACDCEPNNPDVFLGAICSISEDCRVFTCDPQGSGECLEEIAPEGSLCGGLQVGGCSAPNRCDSFGNCLTNVQPAGTPCRSARDPECDFSEFCDGESRFCPSDIVAESEVECGEEGSIRQYCTINDACNGLGACSGEFLEEGFETEQDCNANEGEPRCDGKVVCGADGLDICVLNDESFELACTEQIIEPEEVQVIESDNCCEVDTFGTALVLRGFWAAIDNGNTVELYKWSVELTKWFKYETLNTGSALGCISDIHMDGRLLAISGDSGARLYELRDETWNNLLFESAESFGSVDAISVRSRPLFGDTLVISNKGNDKVCVYDTPYLSNAWNQVNPFCVTGDQVSSFGADIDIKGDLIAISLPFFEGLNGVKGISNVFKILRKPNGTISLEETHFIDSLNSFPAESIWGVHTNSLKFDAIRQQLLIGASSAQVYVYDLDASNEPLQIIDGFSDVGAVAPIDPLDRGFGSSISQNGNRLIIGDPSADGGVGKIHIYTRAENGDSPWVYHSSLTSSQMSSMENFGFRASLDGNFLLAGAPGDPSVNFYQFQP